MHVKMLLVKDMGADGRQDSRSEARGTQLSETSSIILFQLSRFVRRTPIRCLGLALRASEVIPHQYRKPWSNG